MERLLNPRAGIRSTIPASQTNQIAGFSRHVNRPRFSVVAGNVICLLANIPSKFDHEGGLEIAILYTMKV